MAEQSIEAPEVTPPLYGLVIAAPEITATSDDVWGSGWVFSPEGCGTADRLALGCGGNGPRTPTANGARVHGKGFLVWAADRCSTFGFQARNYEARARRQLAASESFQIADELWGGELSQANGLPNRWLTDSSSDTLTSAPVTPQVAVAALVGALGKCGKGQLGMLHVTPQILVLLQDSAAVIRDGNIWRTPMGHRVVADDGYDGSGPGGVPATGSQWAYATSTIRTRRGPVEVPGTFEQNVDYEVNTITVYAQRMAGFEWTNECCHMAAEIDVPVPLIGPPS